MHRRLILLILFLGYAVCSWAAGPVTLAWDAPTTSSDDTPLTDLSYYKVYWGTTSGVYTSGAIVGNVTQFTVKGLNTSLIYFFVVTAVDTSEHESVISNEVSVRPSLVLHQ